MAIKNIIVNGNFETDERWVPSSPAAIVSDGNAMNSSRCLRFINRSTGGLQQAFQTVPIVKGARYELYFWAKRTGRMDVWAAYAYYDANGVRQMVHAPSMLNTVTGSYTRQYWSFTVPSNASNQYIAVYILSGGNPGDTATAWVDNAELWGEEYIETPDEDPYANLLKDSGFEENNGSWQLDSPATIVAGNQMQGSKCLCFPNRSTGGQQAARQYVNIVPGGAYTLYFYIKRSGTMSTWTSCEYTQAGGTSGYFYTSDLLSQTSSSYTMHKLTFTIPSNAASNRVRIAINASGNAGESATVWVDRVELRGPAPDGDTLYTGYINAPDTAVRSSMSVSSDLLGRYPTNAPIGYRATSSSDWLQTYYGFKPGNVGYTISNYITPSSITKARLLADIAGFWKNKGWGRADFGMENDWCQWFVNWCVTQAGLVPGNAWVTNNNCIRGWSALSANAIQTPTLGYIFYTKTGSDTVSHTGIVVEEISSTRCMVIDGNYNGSTSLTRREMDISNMPSGVTLLGFVKPIGM